MSRFKDPVVIVEESPAVGDLLETELLKSLRQDLAQAANASVVLAARNSDGLILGGLSGGTSYGWLLIKVLWVRVEYRHAGLGRSLMNRGET